MADAMSTRRGGKRDLKGASPPSGPGPFAKRTDRDQPIRTPSIDDPDIQSGDVARSRQAQQARRIPQRNGPQLDPAARRVAPSLSQMRQGSNDVPDFVSDQPSTRPGEDVGHGSMEGGGAGPEALTIPNMVDEREVILQALVDKYQNPDAYEMLFEMQQPLEPVATAPAPEPTLDSSGVESETSAEAPSDSPAGATSE